MFQMFGDFIICHTSPNEKNQTITKYVIWVYIKSRLCFGFYSINTHNLQSSWRSTKVSVIKRKKGVTEKLKLWKNYPLTMFILFSLAQ